MNIYKDAIEVQNACNLSGVAHSLADVCSHIMRTGGDSETIKTNPAVILFVDKLNSLLNRPSLKEFHTAYMKCEDNLK
jgi:hypothetical protein